LFFDPVLFGYLVQSTASLSAVSKTSLGRCRRLRPADRLLWEWDGPKDVVSLTGAATVK